MHILKRQNSNKSSRRRGKKSLLRRVFSFEKKLSQRKSSASSNLKVLDHDRSNGSIDMSKPKLSSNSLPGLAEADSFDSIWATRSDSSAEEVVTSSIDADYNHHSVKEVVYSDEIVEPSPSFEAELSLLLQETIKRLPELDAQVANVQHVEDSKEESEGLEIDCSDDAVEEEEEPDLLTTPPSSTDAIFAGDFGDFSIASEGSTAELIYNSTDSLQHPEPKAPVDQSRSQDIFRPKEQPSFQSLVPRSSASHGKKIDHDLLLVRFTPSFEGIEMTRSFQQLDTIDEEPSWYTPSMSFEMDENTIKCNSGGTVHGSWKTAVRYFVTVMMLFLLVGTYDNRLSLDKVGMIPLTEIITPALEDLLVQHATDGPAVKKTFYNSHHTVTGVWLK